MITTALYFGSYNPVHKGHTAIAKWIVANNIVDELWFVPSPQNPFKTAAELAPEELRAEMLELAINEDFKYKISVCRIEFSLPKPSYTINTLNKLTADFPQRKFVLVIGADNLVGIRKWREYEQILKNFEILVYPRPNTVIDRELLSTSKITILDGAPLFDISSTELRAQFKIGKFDYAHISKDIINYIKINNLYV
jgi:nicotinate-nucleotide adenylyltransferase